MPDANDNPNPGDAVHPPARPDEHDAATLEAAAVPPEAMAGSDNRPPMATTQVQEADLEYWESLDEDSRQRCYDQLRGYYDYLLEEFRNSANKSVEKYKVATQLSQSWRFWLIVLTGGLAVINVLATGWPADLIGDEKSIRPALSFIAAIYAVLLALATNLESYRNYADQVLMARDSRELFLDAYREFEMLRLTNVYPFGYSAQGCLNFHDLYRQLVNKDTELRRKLRLLSETKPK